MKTVIDKRPESKTCIGCKKDFDKEVYGLKEHKCKDGTFTWNLANSRCPSCRSKERKKYYYKNQEKAQQYTRQWNADNKERKSATGKAYYAAHREEDLKRRKRYAKENFEKEAARKSKWYQDNKERLLPLMRESKKKWRSTPKGKALTNAYSRKRLANKRAAIKENSKVAEIYKQALLLQQKLHSCVSCDDPLELDIHVDHIIPVKMGGKTEPNNLQLLSARENLKKGAKAYSVLGAPRFG